MATAPRRTSPEPEAPSVNPSEIAPESQDAALVRETAADRGLDPTRGPDFDAPDPIASTSGHAHPSPERIAAEAYAIYLANGERHGRDIDDWLEAERRLGLHRDPGAVDG